MRTLDLRGVKCPLNYVKVKAELEEIELGEILEIFVDDGEPILNIPRSIKDDGNELTEVNKIDGYFRISIRKKQ